MIKWLRQNNYKILLLGIFLLGTGLRVTLAIINSESNDDHFSVIDIIRNEGRLPAREECWECFQPKFYHWFIAQVWGILPVESRVIQIRVAQIINSIAGILTIGTVYLFFEN